MKQLAGFIFLLLSITFISCDSNDHRENANFTQTDDGKIVLSFVTQEAPRSPSHQGFLAFAKKLKELSNDTMNVDINQLTLTGSLDDIFRSVCSGDIDIAAMGYADRSNIIPELAIVGKAYVVRDYEHFLKILDSEYGRRMDSYFGYLGLIHSNLWYLGFRHTTSNTPINTPENFEGLNFRIQPTGSLRNFATTLLANPIEVRYNELYDALKLGKVNAQENPIPNIEATKVYEFQKYIAMTGHLVGTISLFINKEKYESFTDEQKAWYNEAIEYGGQICYDVVVEQEARLLDIFQYEYGMTVTYPDKDKIIKAIEHRYKDLEKELGEGAISTLMNLK